MTKKILYLCNMNPKVIKENMRRCNDLAVSHDPATGDGAVGTRCAVEGIWLPETLVNEHPEYSMLSKIEKDKLRFQYDFEYWCWRCIKIADKLTGQLIPFVLNRPQQKLLSEMEKQRLAGQPIRIILLKARQWGGSTLVQIYIAWHQIILYKGKNSVIVGHKRSSSSAIKQMYRTILKNYPREFMSEDEILELRNIKEANDIQEIASRDCTISMTSSYSTDSSRGQNLSLAHLSEVAFWKSNRSLDPNDLVRSITGTIPLNAGTIIVMESTANGVNSFFYNEWERAVKGQSAFLPIFVSWAENPIYQKPLDENFDFDKLDSYEQSLWEKGCSLEQIYWYHEKRKEFSEHTLMKAEFPSDSQEAFESSIKYVFSNLEQEQIIENIKTPASIFDEVNYWADINHAAQFLVVLTIGSENDVKKPSVISVWNISKDEKNNINLPSLAAQWKGTISLSLLALKACKIAQQFNNAVLSIDNNDLESTLSERSQGGFVIQEIGKNYRNFYNPSPGKFMLDLNRNNLPLLYYELILNAKNQLYIDFDEISSQAVAKLTLHPNGRYYGNTSEDGQFILNRAEMLFIIRDMNLKSSPKYTVKDIHFLTSDPTLRHIVN